MTVLQRADTRKTKIFWLCRCDCGNEKLISGESLKNGYTKSCGCICKEKPNGTKHGGTGTRLYREWSLMRRRCHNQNSHEYKYYGARGISICKEWDDFNKFRTWANNSGYSDTLTLDRIDFNGGYSPNNCRWATIVEQQNNKTSNIFYDHNGRRQTIAQWAKEYGLSYMTLYLRLRRRKLNIEEALHKKARER